jgi:hypothetical protein
MPPRLGFHGDPNRRWDSAAAVPPNLDGPAPGGRVRSEEGEVCEREQGKHGLSSYFGRAVTLVTRLVTGVGPAPPEQEGQSLLVSEGSPYVHVERHQAIALMNTI